MKAIFYLPAHPSYFADEYTQEEIDAAIKLYDTKLGGAISNGNPRPKVPQEFRLLRQPGKSVTVTFDSTGLGEGRSVSEADKQRGTDQYRMTSHKTLATHVHNIRELMKLRRAQSEE